MNGRGLIVLAAALLVSGVTARLGWWQLDRAEQKLALQADIDRRAGMPALLQDALASDAAQAAEQAHRPVSLQGRWLPDHTVFLDNRQMDGRFGFVVVTPLALSDGSAVLVQRGFLARDFVDRARIHAPATPEGVVRVEGRLAGDPARLYEFDGADEGTIRQNLSIESFAAESGLRLRPVTVLQQVDPAPADDGLQRQWPRPAANAQKNQGYAFQWFALSALSAGLYVWFRILRPHVRKPPRA